MARVAGVAFFSALGGFDRCRLDLAVSPEARKIVAVSRRGGEKFGGFVFGEENLGDLAPPLCQERQG